MTELCHVKSNSGTGYGANVFVVETPLQLLNAIEAKQVLQLTNSHLVVRLGGTGFSPNGLKALVGMSPWNGVHYLEFKNATTEWESSFFGQRLLGRLQSCAYDIQRIINRHIVDRLATKFVGAKRIFLGNYVRGHQSYMRHFANRAGYEQLFLLDDGTDVLLICEARREAHDSNPDVESGLRLKDRLRRYLVDWDETEAESVTFFTAYELQPASCDRVIKNEYRYLRDAAADSARSDEVYFLGQSLVEDGYVSLDFYLHQLQAIKNYYREGQLIYIPHPRQTIWLMKKIEEAVGIQVRLCTLPIECEVALAKSRPAAIASFFCSALQSCRAILGKEVPIHSFYIEPEHVCTSHELVREAYRYFEVIADSRFTVIKVY
jgi:Alpha-2,8-polysialyltransferase (POLYST)